jgi:hypothetical protein
MHPLSSLDPSICGMSITTMDRATWTMTTLKLLKQFLAIMLPGEEEGHIEDMVIREGQIPPTHTTTAEAMNDTGVTTSNKGKAPAARVTPQPRQSEGDTSPERRAHSAPVDPTRIKIRQNNGFHPLVEEQREESSRNNDRVRDGSVLDANSSRGARMRDPISLTP